MISPSHITLTGKKKLLDLKGVQILFPFLLTTQPRQSNYSIQFFYNLFFPFKVLVKKVLVNFIQNGLVLHWKLSECWAGFENHKNTWWFLNMKARFVTGGKQFCSKKKVAKWEFSWEKLKNSQQKRNETLFCWNFVKNCPKLRIFLLWFLNNFKQIWLEHKIVV